MSEGVKNLMQLKIVAGALVGSVFVYVVVVFVLFMDPDPDQVANTTLLFPMAGMAGLSMLAILPLRKMLLGTFALPFLADGAGAGPQWSEQVEQAALAKYATGTIVGLAVAESVAIYGLVASFLAQDPMLVLPFAATAVLLMAAQFPSDAGLRAVAAASARA